MDQEINTQSKNKKSFVSKIKEWPRWKLGLIIGAGILLFILLAFIIIGTILFISGSSNSYDYDYAASSMESYYDDGAMYEESMETSADDYNGTGFDVSKIVYSGNIELYIDDYQESYDQIADYTEAIGGFIEESYSDYIDTESQTKRNSGYLTIRVPSDVFAEALEEIGSYGVLISTNVSSQNITQQYRDIQTKVGNLKISEARLLEYLNKSDNLPDLLAVETELNRVRTEIDSLQSMINNWDTQINYSTIRIELTEKAISTTSLESPFSGLLLRIQEAFVGSVNLILRMMAGLIILLIRILPFAVVGGVIFLIYRKIRKNGHKKEDSKK